MSVGQDDMLEGGHVEELKDLLHMEADPDFSAGACGYGAGGGDEGAFDHFFGADPEGFGQEPLGKTDVAYSTRSTEPPNSFGIGGDTRTDGFGTSGLNATAENFADWHHDAIRPDSQDAWEQRTKQSLSHAKMLTKQAMKAMSEADHLSCGAARKEKSNSNNVQHMFRKKVSATSDIIKALEDRIESVEDTIRQVGECLFSLQRAHRSKWAPLNVAERRLELREGRPLQELIRDHCQEAIENERQTLLDARQELSAQIESSKEMLRKLDSMKATLLEDLQHKRHGLRIDRSCINPSKMSKGGSTQDRVVLPQLQEVAYYAGPPSPGGANKSTGSEHESSWRMDARQVVEAAIKLEEEAMRLCNTSDAVMLHCRKETVRASAIANSALQRRMEETAVLKKKLETQMQETDVTIQQTELSLNKTRKKLEWHEQPLRELDKQFQMRQKRTLRESIRDPVHEELETHLDTVKANVKSLTTKWQATQTLLDQLRESRQNMLEDYRAKLTAFKIDEACLKITPRKAIELDRMDPRSGRCLKGSTPRGGSTSGMAASGLVDVS